jgi:hypothetical protein
MKGKHDFCCMWDLGIVDLGDCADNIDIKKPPSAARTEGVCQPIHQQLSSRVIAPDDRVMTAPFPRKACRFGQGQVSWLPAGTSSAPSLLIAASGIMRKIIRLQWRDRVGSAASGRSPNFPIIPCIFGGTLRPMQLSAFLGMVTYTARRIYFLPLCGNSITEVDNNCFLSYQLADPDR